MSNLPTISILPASPEDAPSLTRIHGDAFKDSALTDLMFGPPTEENLKGFTGQLAELIAGDKTTRFVKAVDNDTNNIVGWSWWDFHPDYESRVKGSEAFAKNHADPPESAISPEAYKEYFRGVEVRREKWVGERPVAFLRVLVVLPEYQRKGIGAKLMTLGLEEAAAQKLPVWLESSEEGYALYKKLGFKDLNDSIVIDLAKYGESGITTTACMLLENGSS
ncbi:acyl-CoA N-acyltransferase [Aspergillus pseudocaelatus]|uniref:Acyl-CoA N-acyltransferase n=1 Tax=Aspergillus pseudocaelatus TaxID=1825620 RepID=A0ABQ6X3I7_9EURO|nr:acyl-CoA N-acyltransferase [Aspergillus pseudocaelatus]